MGVERERCSLVLHPHAHQARRGTAFLLQEQAVVENLAQRKVEAGRSLHRKVIYDTLYFYMPM